MDNEDESLSFASFYFGNKISPGSLSDRLLAWSKAFESWVEHKTIANKRLTAECHLAWRRLAQHCRKMPWEITQQDISGHMRWMREQGYKNGTISCEMYLISSFYQWCATEGVDELCGRAFNPTQGVRKPHIQRFEGMSMWSSEEIKQLLELVGRDESVLGKREKAFFLLRLNSGVPLKKLLNLRWEQVEQRGDDIWVKWSERFAPTRLAVEVWAAIIEYLMASGRLEGMEKGKLIFASRSHGLIQGMSDTADDWVEDRPMWSSSMVSNLRVYGRRLGINEEKLNMQALRRTALRLQLDAGDSVEGVSQFTGRQQSRKTIKYLLRKVPHLAQDTGNIPQEATLPNRHLHRLQGDDAIKHGMYSRKHDADAVRQVMQEGVTTLDEEISGLRALMKGLVDLGMNEGVTLEAYTMSAGRLGELIAFSQLDQTDEQKEYDQMLKRWDTMHSWDPEIPSGAQLVEAANQAYGSSNTQQELAVLRVALRNVYRRAETCQEEQEYVRLVHLYGKGCLRLKRMLERKNDEISIVERYVQEGFDRAFRELRIEYGIEDDE